MKVDFITAKKIIKELGQLAGWRPDDCTCVHRYAMALGALVSPAATHVSDSTNSTSNYLPNST